MSYCKNNLLLSHLFVCKEKENCIRVTKFVLYICWDVNKENDLDKEEVEDKLFF
jgi:hypothetical protein